jgi:hypothetical protein
LNQIILRGEAVSIITSFSHASVVEPLHKVDKLCSCKTRVLQIAEQKTSDMEEILDITEDMQRSVVYADDTGNIIEASMSS